jgi:hypothetical protein
MLKFINIAGVLFSLMLLSHNSHAEGQGVEVNGTLDLYYSSSMNGEDSQGTFYGNDHDQLGVGMAQFTLSGSTKNVDWLLDFVYGDNIVAGDAVAMDNLAQAYLTHNMGHGLSITAGRMATNVGFEGTYAKDNWNYSRSLAFQFAGPFFHEGAALKYAHDSGFGAGVFFYNGADSTSGDDDDKGHDSSAQLSYTRDNWSAVYNYYTESQDDETMIHNLNLTYDLNKMASFAVSHTINEDDLEGSDQKITSTAIYARVMPTEKVYGALRYEMASFEDGAGTAAGYGAADNDVNSITATAGYYCDSGSEFRLEIRQDTADNAVYSESGETVLADDQLTLTGAWIHTF